MRGSIGAIIERKPKPVVTEEWAYGLSASSGDPLIFHNEAHLRRAEALRAVAERLRTESLTAPEPRPDLALLHAQGQLPWPDQHRKVVIVRRPFAALRHRLQRQLAPQWKELASQMSKRLAVGQPGEDQQKTALQLLHEKWLLEHPEEKS